jgi:hypothetical protein
MQPLVVTVIGKAFFDIGHAPVDQSNRRTDLQGYAAWEIRPVMMFYESVVAICACMKNPIFLTIRPESMYAGC